MKTELIVPTLIALAILWGTSVTFAYHRGYRHGGDTVRVGSHYREQLWVGPYEDTELKIELPEKRWWHLW